MKITLFGALLAAHCTTSWAINKCIEPDGRIAYQEASCAHDAKASTIKKVAVESTYETRLSIATQQCGIGDLPELPPIGWTEEKFRSCSLISLRSTPIINITETAHGISKQYVFRYWKVYVYVRNGMVTSIQR